LIAKKHLLKWINSLPDNIFLTTGEGNMGRFIHAEKFISKNETVVVDSFWFNDPKFQRKIN
jgi:hypothetical protein